MSWVLIILTGIVLAAVVLGGPLIAVITIFDRSRTKLRIVLITGILLILLGFGVVYSGLDELIVNFLFPLGIFNLLVWGFKKHYKPVHRHFKSVNEEAIEEGELSELRLELNENKASAETLMPVKSKAERLLNIPLWLSFGIGLGLILLFFEFLNNELNFDNITGWIFTLVLNYLIIISGLVFFVSVYIKKNLSKIAFQHLILNVALTALLITLFQKSLYFFEHLAWDKKEILAKTLLTDYIINFGIGAILGYILLPGKNLLFKDLTKRNREKH